LLDIFFYIITIGFKVDFNLCAQNNNKKQIVIHIMFTFEDIL